MSRKVEKKNSSVQLGISEGQRKKYKTRSRILDKRVVQPKEMGPVDNFRDSKTQLTGC